MIGFIGFGRMGSALAKGAIAAKVIKASQIVAFDHNSKARKLLKTIGVKSLGSAADVVRKADIIFLCVKPQGMQQAIASLGGENRNKCFVSIAAGIPIQKLQMWLGGKVSVFRVMPNTPALLQSGMSAMSRGKFGSAAQEKKIKQILLSVGEVVQVPESWMDAVTAISGSGPAYVFYLAEALIAGAQKLGLKSDVAKILVHQTIMGAGLMLSRRSEPAEELRRQVTSPGGTTAAAVAVFDKKNFKKIIEEAVRQAAKRSAELAKN